MGLPDMLRARLPHLPPIIDLPVDFHRPGPTLDDFFEAVGSIFTQDRLLIRKAFQSAHETHQQFQKLLESGLLPPEAISVFEDEEVTHRRGQDNFLKIGLLGHAYNLYDPFISMDLIGKLRKMDASVITADSLPPDLIEQRVKRLPKRLFWTLGKKMLGAALNFFENKQLDGIIYLTSFGCGPESFVGELVERWAKRRGVLPLMLLTIDEHTGEAGLVTRLEAFLEMIKRRKKNENHLSTYG
jgi:predicted nucleotide-binding protein (sugar kinase/HSP70/actin superfamily)